MTKLLPIRDLVKSGKRGAETVSKIINVAERLFGEFGIGAVSLRQIRNEAGISNKAAIEYHFGDRDGLIWAIWHERLPSIEADRARKLCELIKSRLDDCIPEILKVLFIPSFSPVDDCGQHRYAAFLRQALRWRGAMSCVNLRWQLLPAASRRDCYSERP